MFRKYPKRPKSDYVWHLEHIGLLLFFMTVPMGNAGIVLLFSFATLFMFLTFMYITARALARRDPWFFLVPFKSGISLVMLALFIPRLLSAFNATDFSYYDGVMLRFLVLYILVVMIAFVIKNNKHILYALIFALLIGSVPTCLAGIYEVVSKRMVLKRVRQQESSLIPGYKGISELPGKEGEKRIGSLDGGGAEHAIHCIVYASLFTTLLFVFRNRFMKIISFLFIIALMVNVAGTASRTGMIGLALAVVVFLCFIELRARVKILAVFLLIASAVAVIFIFKLPIARLLGKSGSAVGTTFVRMEQYQTAYTMITRHPVLGVGLGNFMPQYRLYQYNYPGQGKYSDPFLLHNVFLNQLAETGVIGLVSLLFLLGIVFLKLYEVKRHSSDRLLRVLAVSLMAALAGWSGALLFYPTLMDEQGWMLMGLTVGLGNIHRQIEGNVTQRRFRTT